MPDKLSAKLIYNHTAQNTRNTYLEIILEFFEMDAVITEIYFFSGLGLNSALQWLSKLGK